MLDERGLVVVGMGGVGSWLAHVAVRELVRATHYNLPLTFDHLHGIDYDQWENKNAFTSAGGCAGGYAKVSEIRNVLLNAFKGKFKAVPAFQHMTQIVPGDWLLGHISRDHVVLDCTDNHATQILLHKDCERYLRVGADEGTFTVRFRPGTFGSEENNYQGNPQALTSVLAASVALGYVMDRSSFDGAFDIDIPKVSVEKFIKSTVLAQFVGEERPDDPMGGIEAANRLTEHIQTTPPILPLRPPITSA